MKIALGCKGNISLPSDKQMYTRTSCDCTLLNTNAHINLYARFNCVIVSKYSGWPTALELFALERKN